jgi:GAF domain
VKRESPTSSEKPFVDVASFQEFLSAAYVVQQHNERLQGEKEARGGTSRALGAIVEIEEQIRDEQLGLQEAAEIIAQRAQEISHAAGVAIGVVEKDQLVYYAATGSASSEAATREALAASLSAECLQSGQILQSRDAEKDLRLPSGLCREREIKALLAAPATRQGKVVGVVELRFAYGQSFEEEEVRNCQLWADLLAETIARKDGVAVKKAPAAGHETVQETLERIKPHLARLAGEEPPIKKDKENEKDWRPASPAEPAAREDEAHEVCRGCGHVLTKDEQFCGLCGTQRAAARQPLQSTWASLWDLQKKAEKSGAPLSSGAGDADSFDLLPSELERLVEELAGAAPQEPPLRAKVKPPEDSLRSFTPLPISSKLSQETEEEESVAAPEEAAVEESAPVPAETNEPSRDAQEFVYSKPESPAEAPVRFPFASGRMHDTFPTDSSAEETRSVFPEESDQTPPVPSAPASGSGQNLPAAGDWTSASKARAWLDSVQGRQTGLAWLLKQWQAQRANIYLGAAALLLVAVLFGFGAPDSPVPTPVKAQRPVPAAPELSLFDKVLVNLGLAEAPPAPVYEGNPNTKVWIDTHTALYYCPGMELYGKASGGKFVTQREAQMDAFQPAARKPCD